MVLPARAKKILGKNFIGVEELIPIADKLSLSPSSLSKDTIPVIPYSEEQLYKVADTHLLVLAVPKNAQDNSITIMERRGFYGINPAEREPCFYNQDWYVKEVFAYLPFGDYKWYLLNKELIKESRGKAINDISDNKSHLPSALICTYTFFVYYHHAHEYLWENDFVWCSDTDVNGDRIYIGRYLDPIGIAKNGFSIHRHLSVNKNYGCIELIS